MGAEQTLSANGLPRACEYPCSSTSSTAPRTLGGYGPEVKVECKSGIPGKGDLCNLARGPERQQPEPSQLHTALTIFSLFPVLGEWKGAGGCGNETHRCSHVELVTSWTIPFGGLNLKELS